MNTWATEDVAGRRFAAARGVAGMAGGGTGECCEQEAEENDEQQVAAEDEPRLRPEGDHVPVAGGKPELRRHERGHEEAAGCDTGEAADEWNERDEPDEELRREHLAHGDE